MKGGGNHASGASSAEDGLVIDLSNLKEIKVDTENGRATVGGGCRWGDVYSTLQKHGVICVGGGVHIVGVGGHLTGGESHAALDLISFLLISLGRWLGPTYRQIRNGMR